MSPRAPVNAEPLPGTPTALALCHCIGLRRAARRLSDFYERMLEGTAVTVAQFGLLSTIAANPGTTMARLAGAMGLDPSTLSRTIRPLEAQGWVEIATEGDRRARQVRLTAAGRAKAREATTAWKAAQARAEEVLPKGAVRQLLAAMDAL